MGHPPIDDVHGVDAAARSVQRAGRGAMDAAAFLRGLPVPAGTRLG